MAGAIDLNEHAFLGIPFPTEAMTASPSLSSGTGDARLGQDATQRGSGYGHLLPIGEQLGQVLLIDPGVFTARQRHDPAPLARRNPTLGLLPTVSMSQRFGPLGPIPGQHPPDVSHTPTQQLCGLFSSQLAFVDSVQDQ